MNKRVIIGLLLGALLGVVCIVGASLRMPGELSPVYLFAFWFNRLLMGVVIGLLSRPKHIKDALFRGILFGTLISFAFYSASSFHDLTGFLAGLVYGVMIEVTLYYVSK